MVKIFVFALSAIKGVGKVALNAILTEREQNGKFESFRDFALRLYGSAVNKTVLEALIKCGAFDNYSELTRETDVGGSSGDNQGVWLL